ncbi:MAG: AMP-binding protein [Hyphomicrobium sp.]|nr:AMP-binding protein [Hyphomicrobium sp.]
MERPPSGMLDELISAECADTLPGLLHERVQRTPLSVAYREYDHRANGWTDHTWAGIEMRAARFQQALVREDLKTGDRVAVLLPNCTDWVNFDMAALGLGLVVVPLYADDSLTNITRILAHCDARLALLDTQQRWYELAQRRNEFPLLSSVWVREWNGLHYGGKPVHGEKSLSDIIAATAASPFKRECSSHSLATIIYTSGATGRPKGAMLTHFALLWNAEGVTRFTAPRTDDTFLSFLPLAHAFERTVGYYLPMIGGSTVAYARSIEHLPEDLKTIRPTVLLSVPRIYERAYDAIYATVARNPLKGLLLRLTRRVGWQRFEANQGRGPTPDPIARLTWPLLEKLVARPIVDTFGGRLRVAVTGGAPMPEEVAEFLIAMGVPIVAGYGLTEAAPVVAANSIEDNHPPSVGRPLEGIEITVSKDGELLVRSPAVMSGYWKDKPQTQKTIDAEGWLHTGDIAEIKGGCLFILGRMKEVLVLATGEKVNASLVESEIRRDDLVDQALIVGACKPFIVAVCMLNAKKWRAHAQEIGVDPNAPNSRAAVEDMLARVADRLKDYPKHAQVRAVHLTLQPWTVDAGLITPTLKVKRNIVEKVFRDEIMVLFSGHAIFG